MNVYEVSSIQDRLFGNPYVGRGIMVGKTQDGKSAAIAYFIMGRSVNSRNRVFAVENGQFSTQPFDVSKLSDPSLVIYNAIRQHENNLVVTNGDQTDTVYDFLMKGESFEAALNTREFEPDGPNFTPRISAMATFDGGDFCYKMNILKSADAQGSACVRQNFAYPALNGVGHFIHTYVTDGDPIPSFQGEPERVAILNDIDAFTDSIWNNLDENNRVSLYTRYVDLQTLKYEERLVNRNK